MKGRDITRMIINSRDWSDERTLKTEVTTRITNGRISYLLNWGEKLCGMSSLVRDPRVEETRVNVTRLGSIDKPGPVTSW